MVAPILLGLVAAVFASIPSALNLLFRNFPWAAPLPVLALTAVAVILQKFVLDRGPGYRGYDGLADLFVDVHTPGVGNFPGRWAARGLISMLLATFGGAAGPEGAAVEFAQAAATAARGRAARWFEHRRRTDAATALAAGFAAAFWAPFAALLLPVEMGLGGRTGSVAIAALTSYLASWGISSLTLARPFDFGGVLSTFHLEGHAQWLLAAGIAVFAGVIGAGIVRFVRFFQESIQDFFGSKGWLRVLFGGIVLCLVTLVHNPGHQPGSMLLEGIFWGQGSLQDTGLLIFTQLLILTAVLSGFGTIGLFWPTFALGGLLGYGLNLAIGPAASSGGPLQISVALIGGTALWAAVFGTPLSAAVAAYELGQDPEILIPCFLAGLISLQIRRWLRTPALYNKDLEARGLSLRGGKSVKVLESLFVRDAMVVDHDVVQEKDAMGDVHSKMLMSRYPFLPVVNSSGVYRGLLSIDMVQDAYRSERQRPGVSLNRLLEAKDLLYRGVSPAPTVRENEKLSLSAGAFDDAPCIPVLSEDGKVVGLLFSHSIRVAYDREIARRSLVAESLEISE
jgi:H+/Cl- antiporter ClcA